MPKNDFDWKIYMENNDTNSVPFEIFSKEQTRGMTIEDFISNVKSNNTNKKPTSSEEAANKDSCDSILHMSILKSNHL